MAAGRRPGGRRRLARRAAIDLLYQSDLTHRSTGDVWREWADAGRAVPAYGAELAEAVERNREDIDRMLEASADAWRVQRMSPVDRAILRVACQEMMAGLGPAIAISEAVEAARELSGEQARRFVNGVLGEVARSLPRRGEGADS